VTPATFGYHTLSIGLDTLVAIAISAIPSFSNATEAPRSITIKRTCEFCRVKHQTAASPYNARGRAPFKRRRSTWESMLAHCGVETIGFNAGLVSVHLPDAQAGAQFNRA
jgi:hypothetical protein